jgi:hypothetical protein
LMGLGTPPTAVICSTDHRPSVCSMRRRARDRGATPAIGGRVRRHSHGELHRPVLTRFICRWPR